MAKADKLRKKAEALMKMKGNGYPAPSEGDMLKLIHELKVNQIELELQLEEILQTRAEARETAEKYIGLFESAPIGLFTLSRNGIILNCNRYAIQMLGKEKAEIENTSFEDKISKETISEFNKFLQKVFESNNTKQECEISIFMGGQELYLALTGISTKHRDDCFLTAEDVTEKKRAAEILIKNQRLGAIGEMAASIAHDFNNSLQIILGNLDLALHETGSDNLFKYLKIIKNVINDVSLRIRHLQRFGGKNIERKTYDAVNMNILIEEVILQMRPLWKDDAEIKGLSFTIRTAYKSLPKIYGNESELRMVLYKIINNSIEAMPLGGKITVLTTTVTEGVMVTITDTGIGMNEATRTRLFQPFYSTKGLDIGRGLGMSGVHSIIKEHKGNIYIKYSEPGKGTTIEMLLPYMKKTIKEEAIHEMPINKNKEIKKVLKVLWVDDENSIRYVAGEMLKLLGHKSDSVANGKSALQLLEANNYDLVITDLGMPEMNGWQLADAIKKKCNGNMKIAIISGWGDQISENEKEKHGIHFIINKPFSMLQLENLLTQIQ